MDTRIALNLPPGESQASFLDHFGSALRRAYESSGGFAGFQPDGSFVSATEGPVKIGATICHLTLEVVSDSDGVLRYVQATANDPPAHLEWREYATSLVTDALASALSDRKRRFFQRHSFLYVGGALDGEYWVGGFRFAPALANDEQPLLINAERIVYLDFHVDAIDDGHAHAIGDEFALRQIEMLALLLNVPFEKPENCHRWVLSPTTEQPFLESKRLQVGFVPRDLPPYKMPQKAQLCKLGRFEGSIREPFRTRASQMLTLPNETRKIFQALRFSMPFRTAAATAARMYHLSLLIHRFSASASLAYQVAALDAICKVTGAYSGPREFIRAHVPPSEDLDQLVEFLYADVRSAHFHAGEMPLEARRRSLISPLLDVEYVRQSQRRYTAFSLTRLAIIGWLLREAERTRATRSA